VALRSLQTFQADPAVFHLTTITFQPDGASHGKFECLFKDFSVAGAVCHAIAHLDDQFIPFLGAVMFQVLIRARQGVVAALELWASNEYA